MKPGEESGEVMICGIICRDCDHYKVECVGCRAVKGAPFWVAFVGVDRCPIYDCCVLDKKLDNCGQCEDLPCERFTRFRDPSISEENAARTLESMVARLKEMEQSGQ